MIRTPLYSGYRNFSIYWWKEVLNPFTYIHWLKSFIHRGRRGWAVRDTWNLNSYISDLMIDVLTDFKEHKMSYPIPDRFAGRTQFTNEESKQMSIEWDDRLTEMINGFKAANNLMDGVPEQFVTFRNVDSARFTSDSFTSGISIDHEAFDKWRVEQENVRKKGFETFYKWFLHLWD